MTDEPFLITPHAYERVLEVVYPARITVPVFERYELELRAVIEKFETGGKWHCMVDQSRIATTMPPDLPPRIAELIAWAHDHGMSRVARIVSPSELGRMQTNRILRAAGVSETAMLFQDRESAWAFVTGSKLES